jgi:hypothetical protein
MISLHDFIVLIYDIIPDVQTHDIIYDLMIFLKSYYDFITMKSYMSIYDIIILKS